MFNHHERFVRFTHRHGDEPLKVGNHELGIGDEVNLPSDDLLICHRLDVVESLAVGCDEDVKLGVKVREVENCEVSPVTGLCGDTSLLPEFANHGLPWEFVQLNLSADSVEFTGLPCGTSLLYENYIRSLRAFVVYVVK